MWTTATAAKRFVRHACFRNPLPLFFIAKTFNLTHEDIRKSVRVDYWVANPARTSPGSMFELWISDGFQLFFAVHFLYPKFVLARPKQLMPVTMKFWLDFLVSGLQGHLLRHLAKVGPMFPCNKSHEAMNTCRDWAFRSGAVSLSAVHVRKKVMHCRKKICWTCLFQEFIPALFVLQRHSTHEQIRESVRVKYWVGIYNPARTSSSPRFVTVGSGAASLLAANVRWRTAERRFFDVFV